VRYIFATNSDLKRLVEEGKFRPELYKRIEGNQLWIPSLADRREDIPFFARKWCGKLEMSSGFLLALLQHDWLGNVRELLIVLRKAVARATPTSVLTVDLLELPNVGEIGGMSEAEVDRRVYGMLKEILECRGFSHGKGLRKRIAEILGCHPSQLSRKFPATG
jgi:DNA-binding NtrC family response regulator